MWALFLAEARIGTYHNRYAALQVTVHTRMVWRMLWGLKEKKNNSYLAIATEI